MPKGESSLGEFEQFVLLALLRVPAGASGMDVRREIETHAGRETAIGAVYATLDRLETKGLVASQLGEPTPERGGRAKRLFQLTAQGGEVLNRALGSLRRMADGIPGVQLP